MADEEFGPYCHLCGGNDETPASHTMDCAHSINRFINIEIAAKAFLKHSESPYHHRRLRNALKPLRRFNRE